MNIVAKTDIGLIRTTNEDTYTYRKIDDNNFIAFVCDGMGGHLGGSYAANKVAEVINAEYDKIGEKPIKHVGAWLFETLQKANDAVYEESISNENLRGMGTTVSGVIMVNGELYYAHIGDSRIYVYDEYKLQQITTDHTYVNSLLLNGLITFKQAAKHPKRHVLTNALGIKKNVSVDIGQINLKQYENILVCSDGLYNLLDGPKLLKSLNEGIDLEDKASSIIEKVLKLGGNDNVTLVLLEQI